MIGIGATVPLAVYGVDISALESVLMVDLSRGWPPNAQTEPE